MTALVRLGHNVEPNNPRGKQNQNKKSRKKKHHFIQIYIISLYLVAQPQPPPADTGLIHAAGWSSLGALCLLSYSRKGFLFFFKGAKASQNLCLPPPPAPIFAHKIISRNKTQLHIFIKIKEVMFSSLDLASLWCLQSK